MKDVNLKNMVVLKDFPSNIVEEAIVIFKNNIKIKEVEKAKKNKQQGTENKKIKKDKSYILNEAEMLITNYIRDIEQKSKSSKEQNSKANRKYKRVKKYAYVSTAIIVIQALMILIK